MAQESSRGSVREGSGATATATVDVDAMIRQVEELYGAVTGHEAPPPGAEPYAAIPPEKEPARYIEEQLERLSALVSGQLGIGVSGAAAPPAWVPRVSVWDAGAEVIVGFDLPGVPRSSVRVSRMGNVVEVAGERPVPAATGRACRPLAAEVPIGTFRRSVAMPPGVALDEVKAAYRDGVLEVRAPKAPAGAQARSIPVS